MFRDLWGVWGTLRYDKNEYIGVLKQLKGGESPRGF